MRFLHCSDHYPKSAPYRRPHRSPCPYGVAILPQMNKGAHHRKPCSGIAGTRLCVFCSSRNTTAQRRPVQGKPWASDKDSDFRITRRLESTDKGISAGPLICRNIFCSPTIMYRPPRKLPDQGSDGLGGKTAALPNLSVIFLWLPHPQWHLPPLHGSPRSDRRSRCRFHRFF